LDLEFQQLKQEIVRISDTTEWNGFSILNGTAGEAVGERPVYKVTSESTFDTVLIDPTTTREIGGADGGETQTVTFAQSATVVAGTITVGGVEVEVTAGLINSAVATLVAAALSANSAFDSTSGRTVTASGDNVVILYGASEGDVADISFADTDTTKITSTVVETYAAVASASETFAGTGQYAQSGSLAVTTAGADATIYPVFTTTAGDEITMTGVFDASAGTITFTQTAGNNSQFITGDLVYTYIDDSDVAVDTSSGTRAVSLAIDVPGSVPILDSGDLVINGITIGPSYSSDDLLSPSNNASGSSIAKAAAINRYTTETGVNAIVNTNTMSGMAQTGTSVVTGYAIINGYTTPGITSVLNNTRESREAAVTAINRISDKTGVVAVNSDSDNEGIRLVAADGRNIEVEFDSDYSSANFALRTGLKEGVQAGTYSLESLVDDPIVITTTSTGEPTNAGITVGDYSTNESTLSSASRAEVDTGGTPVTLTTGDLVINGVAIGSATASLDTITEDVAITTLTNQKAASGVAMAGAINAVSALTGVTATANPVVAKGMIPTLSSSVTGLQPLWINGIEISVNFQAADTVGERTAAMLAAINPKVGQTGVVATENLQGGVTLTTEDGRNLSIWIDDSGSATAAMYGLVDSDAALLSGVAIASASATSTISLAATLYGGVTLHSDAAFTVEPGASGYATTSNFTALGFSEGTFGGIVDAAVTKMTPPNVGRLSFHVGASANQTVSVDLADFGSGGTITGDITGDVLLWDKATRVNRIDSQAAATAVLAKLDVAMDKVNGTRATMGAIMNRLEHTIDNLMNVSVNTSASRSQIEDADYAAASTELARTQIMQQAATAILAQANADQQGVLKLLQ
jgi:flagellin